MIIAELVGKRVLASSATPGYRRADTFEEWKILEISPSGSYVRVMNGYGLKKWYLTTAFAVVEVLPLPEPYPMSDRGGK